MVGVPGSGKTFLAKSLSEKFNCEILNRDIIRTSIFPKEYIDHSKSQNNIAFEAFAFAFASFNRPIITCVIIITEESK